MIKIVVADDHKIMREGLEELLSEHVGATVVGSASDGAETITKVNDLKPDLLVLDLSMPLMDGFEVIRQIRRLELPVKIIVLSMHKDARTIRRALDAEVDGYVIKDEAFDMLSLGVDAVRRGQKYLSPASIKILREQKDAGDEVLTAREREVAILIARGLASKEIATELGITVKTAENHRQNIMLKLNFHKSTEIVRYVLERGLA